MIKIIFLDIDGVLAIPNNDGGLWRLNLEKQLLLGEILEKTDAKIVLSSSWRKNDIKDTILHMIDQGFKYHDKIIGITIRAYQYINKGGKIHLSIPRGVEIKQYIDTHLKYPWCAYPERKEEFEILYEDGSFKRMKSQDLGKDYQYVIIDDDSDMLLEHKDRFIQTDSEIGFTKEHVNKAIEILNKIV